jgi:2-amino-4-hydroxy-6-hydroxymethyldihydropteridine diphosphokinase
MAMLQKAVDELARTVGITVVAVSPVFETDPVGGPEQPDFLNAVVIAETSLSAGALLAGALAVEELLGRERTQRWGPRTIDIDLLTLGDAVVDQPDLKLPHPRAHERAFVLVPWVEVDPRATLSGRPIAVLADVVDRSGIRRRADLELQLPTGDRKR